MTTLSLDLQNATNRQNTGGQYYDEGSNSIKYWYQAGLIPILAYKIEFQSNCRQSHNIPH